MAPSMAVGRRPQLLAMWTSPQGCLSVLTTWRLTSPRVSDPRQRKKKAANALYRAYIGIHFCLLASCILPIRSESLWTTTLKGWGIWLYLLKGRISKNLQAYFNLQSENHLYCFLLLQFDQKGLSNQQSSPRMEQAPRRVVRSPLQGLGLLELD